MLGERVHFVADDFLERASFAFFNRGDHLRAGPIFDSFQFGAEISRGRLRR